MTDGFEALHKRFGDRRPGLELLAIEEAAVPVTVVGTDVLAQERKPLPLLEEFVIRYVSAGVTKTADIAAVLGLNEGQVSSAAAVHISENNLRYNNISEALSITAQGRQVSRTLEAVKPVLKQLPVVFDRLTWQMVDYPRHQLVTKKRAQELGLQVLPASQNSRINLADVTAERFNALLARRGGRTANIEILKVRKVSPNTHQYMQAQLLIYGAPERAEVQLGLCIEGDLSSNHDLALQRIDAVGRLGISVGSPAERPPVPDALEQIRVSRREVEQLSQPAEGTQNDSGGSALAAIQPEMAVRSVGVFEHATLLSNALDNSRVRLLIIAPWIRNAVVTTTFLQKLERRLRAGVNVQIAHGYGDDDRGSDEQALKRLTNLEKRYPERFAFTRVKNTHAKILISDDSWVTTSFNWLSFKGDPDRTYRMEEGTLITIPNEVNRAYGRYLELIADQRAE
jgi:hypothetical protein